jgi:soluble lytic murein transglycosylase-like protein
VFKHKIIVFLLLFSFLPPIFFSSAANLSSAVEKHKHIKITSDQLQKLQKYSHLIRYFSNFSFFRPRYKVSPDFIRALILAESNCNTFAVSPKDALGLGQIIHSTGKKAAKDLYKKNIQFRYINTYKLQNLRREDLFDPAINILLTCYLISKYNYRFNGRIDLVVSAWNAGENVDSLKIGLPAPYSETHNLIGKVNAYYLHLLKLRKKF